MLSSCDRCKFLRSLSTSLTLPTKATPAVLRLFSPKVSGNNTDSYCLALIALFGTKEHNMYLYTQREKNTVIRFLWAFIELVLPVHLFFLFNGPTDINIFFQISYWDAPHYPK